jgi:hypothetical protein
LLEGIWEYDGLALRSAGLKSGSFQSGTLVIQSCVLILILKKNQSFDGGEVKKLWYHPQPYCA